MNAVFDTQSLKMTRSGTKADKVRRFYVFYTTDKFQIQKKGGMGVPNILWMFFVDGHYDFHHLLHSCAGAGQVGKSKSILLPLV